MDAPFKKYITILRRAKKKRRQFACAVTAMSVVVSGSVFWQLRGIGTAMTNYGLPSYDDSGGTALPLSNPSDLETAEIWEATIPPLSDNAGENLALIAESQLGYKESASDFVHAEDGESHNGYTRYGAWYGNPYGDWNTLFTYFCMNYAGLKQEVIPYGSGCWAWSLELDKAGFITSVTRGSPKRGDILLIDSNGDGKADTSAIVCGTVEEGEAPGISVIEGDVDGCVAQKFYPYDHEGFIGTVSLDGIVPEPPVMNEAPALPTELLFSSDSDSGIHVEASADAGAFPDDTAMTVYDISQDEAVQAAAGHFGEDELDNISAVAVDITFTSPDGEELEPAEGTSVRVSISLPEEQALEGESFSLLHISDEGDIQQVEDAEVSAEGAQFEAESFSVYVVTSNGTARDKKSLIMANGLRGDNSATNPYVIGVGEPIEVWYDGDDYADCNFTVTNNDYPDNTHRINRDTSFATWDNDRKVWVKIDNNMQKGRFTGSTASQSSDEPLYIVVKNGSTEVDRLYLRVDNNPCYIYLEGERLTLDTALTNLNKNSNKTIYMLEGESLTFSVNGENNGSVFSTSNSNMVSMGTPVSQNGYTDVTYTAKTSHGNTKITVNGQEINIIVQHPMFVKDSNGERDIDRVNEWLSMLSWEPKRNGYHPNSTGYPYCLYDGDNVTLHIPKNDSGNAKLEFGTPLGVYKDGNDTKTREISYDDSLTIVNGSLNSGGNGINVTLQAHNTTDDYSEIIVPVYLKDGNNTLRTMYIKVMKRQHDLLDHADIEIADGGKYTFTKVKRNLDGSFTKTISTYRAYVSGVNKSTLYSSTDDSQTCQFYRDNAVPLDSSVTGYRADQYHVDPGITPGAPQYEFTSKYEPYYDNEGKLQYGNWSNTKYYPSDVDHVVFDVQLTLEPDKETVYTKTESGWVAGSTTNIKGTGDKVLDNVPFNMDHQAVLDAYNKCPNHSGLDFTIMAFSALVEFDLSKELTGDDIRADQFKFGLYASDDTTFSNPVAVATNDGNGIVTFNSLHFEKPGNFDYRIKEIVETPEQDVLYDDSIIDLSISVEEDNDTNQLRADIVSDINTLKFTNHKQYTLPATGGTGTLPFIILGSAMITGATALYIIKRKKEVSC